jgi:hypothetical protein
MRRPRVRAVLGTLRRPSDGSRNLLKGNMYLKYLISLNPLRPYII